MIKRTISNRGECFGGVAKIPIAKTFNVLVEMDFVDYGDLWDFLHIRDTFSRFFRDCVLGTKRKKSKHRKW